MFTSLTPFCEPRVLLESILTLKRFTYRFHSTSMSAVACLSAAVAFRPRTQ
ncbi:MAG: hypothetical protein IPL90_02200 [Holophagales bacterium]|nr:hypothetical protein [Holophagales bacterium]